MANYYLYIAYSISIDKYYIGETDNLERRLHEHNEHLLKGSFTTRATDWTILAFVEVENRVQARKLESFIKNKKADDLFKILLNMKKFESL